MKRVPFKKSLKTVLIEQAHGGSGSRQLLLSSDDDVAPCLSAMTRGFLPSGAVFDWHNHEGIDEFFLIKNGRGEIAFEDDTVFPYTPGDLIYIPARLNHRIQNTDSVENEFIFIRVHNPG